MTIELSILIAVLFFTTVLSLWWGIEMKLQRDFERVIRNEYSKSFDSVNIQRDNAHSKLNRILKIIQEDDVP